MCVIRLIHYIILTNKRERNVHLSQVIKSINYIHLSQVIKTINYIHVSQVIKTINYIHLSQVTSGRGRPVTFAVSIKVFSSMTV